MSKYIDADQIRAEIERRMDKHWDLLPNADSPEDDWTHNELCELGAFKELEHLEQFLDTLPEQPVEGLEEEMDEMWLEYCEDVDYLVYASIARHFAEWGAEHLKR